MSKYKLTEFSHGAGCGCKISPKLLSDIIQTDHSLASFPGLLVGNDQRDDAAVYSLDDQTAIISTTDFFMPIVDDAFDFGRIAAVNAISDVYAMGGTPLMAIAILGWPVNQLPAALANRVLEGGRAACSDAGIPLAGGHSIDSPEPIFGLAVTGRVDQDKLKKNNGAEVGCQLFLTKPLGVGILSTAQKKKKLKPEHKNMARDNMVILNRVGEHFAELPYVKAMTDVTGFGLLGHLSEMCEASQTSARLSFSDIPFLNIDILDAYLEEDCIPGGTHRNWASFSHHIAPLSDRQRYLLCDPQTSGGLLVAVDPSGVNEFLQLASEYHLSLKSFGEMIPQKEYLIYTE
jgi:selenide,water dikinase